MSDAYYGIALRSKVSVLPAILGSVEAWRATDRGRDITLVRSRPDIIAEHLGGRSYFSNVASLEADLAEIGNTPRGSHELAMLELRRVEGGRIPLGLFEPVPGWVLRDLARFVRCDAPLAAGITLLLVRAYKDITTPNVVTSDGELVCRVVPRLRQIWDREMPSFLGVEPEISGLGRIRFGEQTFAELANTPPPVPTKEFSPAAESAFEARMEDIANRVAVGPLLAREMQNRGF